jgi:diketogulonate reductase-like aldo/keto reductase
MSVTPAPTGLQTAYSLANGVKMPRVGLGTYKSSDAEVERALLDALEIGYRCVDTAAVYGNELGVGRAIAASPVTRDEVFISTKVWNADQGYDATILALEESLEKLGTGHVDLYLVHWPLPGADFERTRETWRAMEQALAEECTRAIGVCNFLEHHLKALESTARVSPMVNQIELHPLLQQAELRRYCQDRGIVVQAWAPIMKGRAEEVPELVVIGAHHGRTPEQVALRWHLQHGVAVIPKSVHRERIAMNADVFGFELSAAEMARIDALDEGMRLGSHPDDPPR